MNLKLVVEIFIDNVIVQSYNGMQRYINCFDGITVCEASVYFLHTHNYYDESQILRDIVSVLSFT